MKTAYELFLLFLRIWEFVGGGIVIVSLADLVFSRYHLFRRFLMRVALATVWPLALLSERGRSLFFWQ